jgi:SNF2 family DNA or RNA helicase
LDFERTLLAELPDGQEIEASSAAVLANKLLQWCNGATYTDDKGNWSPLHTAKLDALAEIIEDNPGETVLVAYNYKSDLARIRERFPDAVVLDKEPSTIARWNAGEIRMLLAHPASAGHGLNLQHGGALCVWFGLSWSLELYQQFNARLHRQGQTRPVRIVHLVASGCIDERVMAVLGQKDAQQNALLDALRP